MKIYQIICTNRKQGIIGNLRLEMYLMSEGVADDEKSEIESRFELVNLNKDSEDVISISTVQEYSFFKLKSGRYCICMTKSTSGDIYGYFCHGLILEEGYWPFYPVQLIGSPVFDDSANMNDIDNGYLPVLNSIETGKFVDFERVNEFAKNRIENGIREMISAVVEYRKSNLYSVVLDTRENILLWIAAVQMTFPVKMSHYVTFSTCVLHISDGDYIIQGRNEDDSFEMDELNKHYIFDNKRGIKGKPHLKPKFISIVDIGFLQSRAVLNSFHRFQEQFDYVGIDNEIDGCYNLFLLSSIQRSNLESFDIKSAFDFAIKYGSQDVQEYLFESVEKLMSALIPNMNKLAVKSVTEFIFNTMLNSKKLILMGRVCRIFYSMMDHLVLDFKQPDIEYAIGLYDDMVELCGDRSYSILRYSISEERVNYLVLLLSEDKRTEGTEFYIRIMLKNLIKLGYLWSQALVIKDMPVLIDLCIEVLTETDSNITAMLEDASVEVEYFSRIVMLLYNRTKSGKGIVELIEKFRDILKDMDDDSALQVRKRVSDMGGGKLLIGEFSILLNSVMDRTVFFNNYSSNILDSIPGFKKQYFSEIIMLYIESLNAQDIFTQSLKLLKDFIDNNLSLDDKTTLYIIKKFEEGLPISNVDDDIRSIIPEIRKIKKKKDIVTTPDITGIIDFAVWLEKNTGHSQSIDEILEESPDIGKLDRKRYEEFVRWCLSIIVGFSKSAEDHKRLIRFLDMDDLGIGLYEKYIECIRELIGRDESTGLNVFIQFCVYYFFYLEPRYKILEEEELLAKIGNMIEDVLAAQQRPFIKKTDEGIRKEFEERGLSLPLQWIKVYNEVIDKKRSPAIKRIAEVFKRG